MLKFAVPESDKDGSCYTEIAEKCNKVLELQNRFNKKYLQSNDTPLQQIAEKDCHKSHNHENNHLAPSKIFPTKILRNGSSASPMNQSIPSQGSNGKPSTDLESDKLQTCSANGLFFARPINICSDYDYDKEAQDKKAVDPLTAENVEKPSR